MAIGQRPLSAFHAFREVPGFGQQGFGGGQLGRPHVAGAIADHHLVDAFRLVHGDAFVVDLDLLARFQIVVHDHLAVAADERPSDLDGREPIDVEMGDHAVREIARQEGHVFGLAGHVGHARGGYRLGAGTEDEVHDGQVVDGEIPEDVHVVLE